MVEAQQHEPSNGGPPKWSKDRLAKIEDLELALDAAVHVNRHLNTEIEAVLQQLLRAEQERAAWQEHARRLAKQLARYKRAAGARRCGVAVCCVRPGIMQHQRHLCRTRARCRACLRCLQPSSSSSHLQMQIRTQMQSRSRRLRQSWRSCRTAATRKSVAAAASTAASSSWRWCQPGCKQQMQRQKQQRQQHSYRRARSPGSRWCHASDGSCSVAGVLGG